MKILFSKKSEKQYTQLNFRFQQRITRVLNKFINNKSVDVIKLKGSDGEFRIRVGNYRIQMEKVKGDFLVTKIGRRENFYAIFFQMI